MDQPIEVTIAREIIRVRPVAHRTEGNDIGYIRITSFNEQTTDALRKAIGEISKQISQAKLAGYVLDLRNNPGGLLDRLSRFQARSCRAGRLFDARPYPRGRPAASSQREAISPKASRSWC